MSDEKDKAKTVPGWAERLIDDDGTGMTIDRNDGKGSVPFGWSDERLKQKKDG